MAWIDGLRHRLHVLLHRDAYAREQAEERRFHRDMERIYGGPIVSDLSPDMTALERGKLMRLRLIDSFREDVVYSTRALARSPSFTVMAMLTLAIGVGANAAVFSLLDRLFGQAPAGLSAPDQLRRLYIQLPQHPVQPGMTFPSGTTPPSRQAGRLRPAWQRSPPGPRRREGPSGLDRTRSRHGVRS